MPCCLKAIVILLFSGIRSLLSELSLFGFPLPRKETQKAIAHRDPFRVNLVIM